MPTLTRACTPFIRRLYFIVWEPALRTNRGRPRSFLGGADSLQSKRASAPGVAFYLLTGLFAGTSARRVGIAPPPQTLLGRNKVRSLLLPNSVGVLSKEKLTANMGRQGRSRQVGNNIQYVRQEWG